MAISNAAAESPPEPLRRNETTAIPTSAQTVKAALSRESLFSSEVVSSSLPPESNHYGATAQGQQLPRHGRFRHSSRKHGPLSRASMNKTHRLTPKSHVHRAGNLLPSMSIPALSRRGRDTRHSFPPARVRRRSTHAPDLLGDSLTSSADPLSPALMRHTSSSESSEESYCATESPSVGKVKASLFGGTLGADRSTDSTQNQQRIEKNGGAPEGEGLRIFIPFGSSRTWRVHRSGGVLYPTISGHTPEADQASAHTWKTNPKSPASPDNGTTFGNFVRSVSCVALKAAARSPSSSPSRLSSRRLTHQPRSPQLPKEVFTKYWMGDGTPTFVDSPAAGGDSRLTTPSLTKGHGSPQCSGFSAYRYHRWTCQHDEDCIIRQCKGSAATVSTMAQSSGEAGSPLSSPVHRLLKKHFSLWNFWSEGRGGTTMGAAVGNCCAGRDDDAIKARAREKADKGWDFLRGEKPITDADRFDKAYAENDLQAFVSLLESTEPIAPLPERMHPWAADPKTVGALAVTQLAILAAKPEEVDIKDRLRELGAIPVLVKMLRSPEPDRVHAAVVALSFLCVDNPKNCIEAFECNALPSLVQGMSSDIEGLRGATAQTCRMIYVLDLKYRAEFKKCGGIPALVKLLELPPIPYKPEDLFNQLEAVYHLEDLILESGDELPGYVEDVKKAGAVARLEELVKVDNDDLKEAANYLLVRLAD